MKGIKIFSIHEHEILIYCPFDKVFKSPEYILLKSIYSFEIYLKEVSYFFLKCQKGNCDINPSRILYNDNDINLSKNRLSKYTRDPNVNKDIIFSLSDYYKLELNYSFEGKIFLGSKAEIKEYFLKELRALPNNLYLNRALNVIIFLDQINEKKIKVLEEQRDQIKLQLKEVEEKNNKLKLQNDNTKALVVEKEKLKKQNEKKAKQLKEEKDKLELQNKLLLDEKEKLEQQIKVSESQKKQLNELNEKKKLLNEEKDKLNSQIKSLSDEKKQLEKKVNESEEQKKN